MRIHLEEPPGDVLVFLTGQEEIEHACDRLFEAAEDVDYSHDVYYNEVEAMLILPLYGSMTTGLWNILDMALFSEKLIDIVFLLCMYKVMTFANVQDEINVYSEGNSRIIIIYLTGLEGSLL